MFLDPATNAPWTSEKALRQVHWIPALKKAKVRYRSPYHTRHTFASTMLSASENIAWVSKVMGHANPSITLKIYARWVSLDGKEGSKAEKLWASYQPLHKAEGDE